MCRERAIYNAPEDVMGTVPAYTLVEPLWEVFTPQLAIVLREVADNASANPAA